MLIQNSSEDLKSLYQFYSKRSILTKIAIFFTSLNCRHEHMIIKFKIIKRKLNGEAKNSLEYQSVRLPLHEQYYECPKCLKYLGPVMYMVEPVKKAA